MKKSELIKNIELNGKWVKVRIDTDGRVTGVLSEENYSYNKKTNTGGRRYIGYANELTEDLNTLSNY
jgi:hypothetical protein